MKPQTTLHLNRNVESTVLYMAFDLGNRYWHVALCSGVPDEMIHRRIDARNLEQLAGVLDEARQHFGLEELTAVFSMYEAGFDSFSLHHILSQSEKVENFVVDPASIEVNQRGRRRKTDRIDAKTNLRKLVQYLNGDSEVFSVCVVPSRDDENDRRIERELQTLQKERTRETNRIKGLLKTHGIDDGVACVDRIDEVRRLDGLELGFHEKQELRRIKARLDLIEEQLDELAAEREERLERGDSKAQKTQKLMRLMGIGERSAFGLVAEMLGWREFSNRREVSSFAGYDPSPFETGGKTGNHQGISKAGNRWVRAIMHSVVMNWLRWQPDSELTQWYRDKYPDGTSAGEKRKGRVALARKLLVRLWRYLKDDELPNGAVLTT